MNLASPAIHPWVSEGAERIRFAIAVGATSDWAAIKDLVCQLDEEPDIDAVFIPDHPMMAGDPWTTLAGLAQVTTRLRLGVLVSCVAYRHPAMLARVVADVDRMSGGRMILGLGSGDLPHEFRMLGLDYGTPRTRRQLLEDNLRVILPLLRGEPVTFEGSGFALREAVLPNHAIQQPHVPVLVAGGSRETLRLVAEYGDAANIGAVGWAGAAYTSDDMTARFQTLRQLSDACGRSYDSVLRTGLVGASIGDTAEEALALLDAVLPAGRRTFHGQLYCADAPDEVVAHLGRMADAGCQYLIFVLADTLVRAEQGTVRRLVSDVLPRLQEQRAAATR